MTTHPPLPVTLIEKLEALKSRSGRPSAHNRAVDRCMEAVRQHCSDPDTVERVALALCDLWDANPDPKGTTAKETAQIAIKAFIGEKE